MAEETLRNRAGSALRGLGVVAIDLFFVAAYFALIGLGALGLHILTKTLESQGLSATDLLPVVLLQHAITWIDCIGTLFAAVTILAESVIGRGKVLKVALDALRN